MLKNGALSSVLNTVLSRSQTHKLDITIDFDFTCDQNDSVLELQGNVWAALTAYAERWKKLNLSLSQFDMSELLGLRSRLSSLKECVLHCYEMGPRWESMIDAFQHSPELTHMDLQGMAPNTFVPFTAPNLESFKYRVEICDGEEWNDGDGIPLEYFFNIIRNSPNLVALDVICEYSSYDTVSPRIVKPLLSKLAVNNTAFLRSLLVPALKEATLTTDFYDSERGQPGSPTDFLADFHDLLVESRCSTLSCLAISINLLNQHLLSILQLTPALISFKLHQYTWKDQYDVVMQEFVVQLTNAEAFLPRLEEIDLNLPICRGVDI
ncbi:uncharacterized protein EV420DRAFT_1579571 [Desarmillaria tabescens]|uniref:F-box domain-containing protein n=1 Tax=Armillaria tabescens TaxID=1929756 RepID=A0AA39JFF5_ARMTA|nr:uncharacterized protein EV420DRAFT_1579571 [Desarmillaria tabescens]KAK0441790.1 hypothetical protein EV420DRAFT_1579571 [Desarmillaria tabescens]